MSLMPLSSLCPADVPVILQDHGIENGARLTVRLQREIRTREEVEALVDEMVACNPGADRAKLLRKATFDDEGLLKTWYTSFRHCCCCVGV